MLTVVSGDINGHFGFTLSTLSMAFLLNLLFCLDYFAVLKRQTRDTIWSYQVYRSIDRLIDIKLQGNEKAL